MLESNNVITESKNKCKENTCFRRLLPFHITFIVSILKVVHQEHKHGINCSRFHNVLWYRQEHAHLNPHCPYFMQSNNLINYMLFMSSMNIPVNEKHGGINTLYWILIFHKNLYREIYIACYSTCSTKGLSIATCV